MNYFFLGRAGCGRLKHSCRAGARVDVSVISDLKICEWDHQFCRNYNVARLRIYNLSINSHVPYVS